MSEKDPTRDTWNNKIEYLLSAIGYCVGLGNVWRFPYICYKYGGGAFMIPYIIMIFLCGIPTFLLEAIIGQFSTFGPVKAYGGVRFLKYFGLSTLIVSVFIGVYYNVILAWIGYYIYSSFTSVLPWSKCDPTWGNVCIESYQNSTKTKCGLSRTDCFYEKQVLGLTSKPDCDAEGTTNKTGGYEINMWDLGGIHWNLFASLIVAWLVVGFCVLKGIKASGKMMYVITLFPYVALTILLINGLTLEGSTDGIGFLFKPNITKLAEGEVWLVATGQIFYSCSVALGGVVTLSSFNNFRNNVIRDCMVIVAADTFTSIFGGITIFAYLGYMANTLHMDIKDVATAGPGLVFVVWPEAMTKLNSNGIICAIFAIIFFSMLYFMGVSSMAGLTETVVSYVLDAVPKLRNKRYMVVGITVLCMFLLGVPMICKNGIYLFSAVDAYAAKYNLVIIALIEVIILSWVYGADRLINDLRMMTEEWIFPGWVYLWKFVTPILIFIMFISQIIEAETVVYKCWGKSFNISMSTIIGIPLLTIPVLVILYGAIQVVLKYGFSEALKPNKKWGPAEDEDRRVYCQFRQDDVMYYTLEGETGETLMSVN